MARIIELDKGMHTLVDDEDYDYLMQWNWYVKIVKGCKGTAYAARSAPTNRRSKPKPGRPNGTIITVTIRMHRLLLDPPKGLSVDHKDRNGLNNQKSNLRICTWKDNSANTGPRNTNTSGWKGVSFMPNRNIKPWRATLREGSKSLLAKNYSTAIEAALAYDLAAREHHGEFAYQNFPGIAA